MDKPLGSYPGGYGVKFDDNFQNTRALPVVVQWHWDAVTQLPPGATLLASSSTYPHQAFRVGDRAWGLQFHVEADAAMVTRWALKDGAPEGLLERTVAELPEVAEVWGEVVRRFARLAVGADPNPTPAQG